LVDSTLVTVAIDTEEDNWGSYERDGATTANVAHLPVLQELFDRYGVRPTYLVNSPPLRDAASVRVLGELCGLEAVEIGAHCHPWNTPPFRDDEIEQSMMWMLPLDSNREKVEVLARRIESELGVRPTTFRTGRWSFGETVAVALSEAGFLVDASVTPVIDWTSCGGPDYTSAPHTPYRFDPSSPLRPDPAGSMVELPTTISFLHGDPVWSSWIRHRLEKSPLSRLKVVGLLDRVGLLTRRWLSPEWSSPRELIRLADQCVSTGYQVLALTFHSCSLLPGATPFVRDEEERSRFLAAVESFLDHCARRGWGFATLGEVGKAVLATDGTLGVHR
jgi:hypothetical protein